MPADQQRHRIPRFVCGLLLQIRCGGVVASFEGIIDELHLAFSLDKETIDNSAEAGYSGFDPEEIVLCFDFLRDVSVLIH